MNILTYCIPLVLAGVLFILFFPYAKQVLRLPEPVPDKESLRLTSSDFFAVLIITLLYGIVSFYNLGDKEAPQSFCRFNAWGEYALIELVEPGQLSQISYYMGPYTGYYAVQILPEGGEWIDLDPMERSFASLRMTWSGDALLKDDMQKALQMQHLLFV